MEWFHQAHTALWTMGFTPARDFAFLGDGEGADSLVIVAGPIAFLREALGDLSDWWREFDQNLRGPLSKDANCKAYYDAIVDHYESFIARD